VALLSSDEYDDDHAAAKRAFHGVASGTDLHVWLDRLSELARRGAASDLVKSKWKVYFYDTRYGDVGGFDLRFYEDRSLPPPELYWRGCEMDAAVQVGKHRFFPHGTHFILEREFGHREAFHLLERDQVAELARRCADAESRPAMPPKECFWRAVRRADGVHMRIDEEELRTYQIVIRDRRAVAPAKTFDEELAEELQALPRYERYHPYRKISDEEAREAVSRKTAEVTAERVRGCVAISASRPHPSRLLTQLIASESRCTGDPCGELRTGGAQRRHVRLSVHRTTLASAS
jgi:hypothetical protein